MDRGFIFSYFGFMRSEFPTLSNPVAWNVLRITRIKT